MKCSTCGHHLHTCPTCGHTEALVQPPPPSREDMAVLGRYVVVAVALGWAMLALDLPGGFVIWACVWSVASTGLACVKWTRQGMRDVRAFFTREGFRAAMTKKVGE